jgi:hypothetical protein
VTVTVAVANPVTVDWIYDEQNVLALTDRVGFRRALRQLSAFFAHVKDEPIDKQSNSHSQCDYPGEQPKPPARKVLVAM